MARRGAEAEQHYMSGDQDDRDSRGPEGEASERFLIERWRKAPAIFLPSYEPDEVPLSDGTSYSHIKGHRLIIVPGGKRLLDDGGKQVLDKKGLPVIKGGKPEQVMDTCEYAQAVETVRLSFEVVQADKKRSMRVLEFGIGIRIAANRFLEQFTGRKIDGLYLGVDLNEDVYNEGLAWKKRKEDEFEAKRKDPEATGPQPNIEIELRRGDAGQVARNLLEEIGDDESKKFDIIYSDTFPLSPDEAGVNDWKHIEVLKKLLAKDGAFSFFPYTPKEVTPIREGSALAGIITGQQINLVNTHFNKPHPSRAEVFPPKDYGYLWVKQKPVLILPVMVCQEPIFLES